MCVRLASLDAGSSFYDMCVSEDDPCKLISCHRPSIKKHGAAPREVIASAICRILALIGGRLDGRSAGVPNLKSTMRM